MTDKVYYNSACPICNAGITNQRKRMEACGLKNIEWIDVHTNPEALSMIDASLNQVREKLYVQNINGQLNVGVDAFIYLWSQTRGQRWLAKLFRFPIFNQFTHWMYNSFAKILYRWNCSKRHW